MIEAFSQTLGVLQKIKGYAKYKITANSLHGPLEIAHTFIIYKYRDRGKKNTLMAPLYLEEFLKKLKFPLNIEK